MLFILLFISFIRFLPFLVLIFLYVFFKASSVSFYAFFGFALVCLLFSFIYHFIEHLLYTIIEGTLAVFPPPNLCLPLKLYLLCLSFFPCISYPSLPKLTFTHRRSYTSLLLLLSGLGWHWNKIWGWRVMADIWRIIHPNRDSWYKAIGGHQGSCVVKTFGGTQGTDRSNQIILSFIISEEHEFRRMK